MQQKNLLVFFVISVLVLFGWTTLQNRLWPPPKRVPPPREQRVVLPDDRLYAGLPALLSPAAGLAGLGDAAQLGTQVALAEWTAGDRREWARREEPKPPPPEPRPEVAAAPAQEITLGDDQHFNLQVVLTSRGAGVEGLDLNHFRHATALGKPVKPPERLQLIPRNLAQPSNLLFHYAEPAAERPMDTLGHLVWTVKSVTNGADDELHQVVFAADVPGQDVTITKTYTLRRGDYHLGLEVQLVTTKGGPNARMFRYQLAGAHGLPIEGEWYTYTHRVSMIGSVDSRGNVWRDMQDSRSIGIQLGGSEVLRDEGKYIGYAAVANQYFASVVAVDNQQADGVKKNFLVKARPTLEGLPPRDADASLSDVTVRVMSEPLALTPGQPVVHRYVLYNGPVKVQLLGQLGDRSVDPGLLTRYLDALHLNSLTDYHSPTWVGPFFSAIGWTSVLIFCTNMMHGLLYLLHHIVANYGLCIILLTLIVRGSMFPLSRKQAVASARMQEKMQALAPEVKKLEEKCRHDPMGLQQAKQELYMKSGINPLAMAGSCWIVLLQMPIFMGLYYALQESVHFRLAPFLWIENLAAPDMLFNWGPNIPVISGFLGPYLNILPIIAVVLMLVQQKMVMPPPTDEQQEMQQKTTQIMMVVMGFMFYKMAAGLCLYFIVSSLWGLAERKLFPPPKKAEPVPVGGPSQRRAGGAGGPAKNRPKAQEPNGEGVLHKLHDWWNEVLKQASKK